MADARVGAWIASWNHLEAAYKQVQAEIMHSGSMPVGAWAELVIDQAAVYADLANAPHEVGNAAGEVLEALRQERLIESQRTKEAFERILNGRS